VGSLVARGGFPTRSAGAGAPSGEGERKNKDSGVSSLRVTLESTGRGCLYDF